MGRVLLPPARPAPYPPLDGSQMCATTDPELFFSTGKGFDPRPAKELCARCPLRRPCLAYALTHAVEGVWGGTTEDERRELRTRYAIGRPIPVTYRPPEHPTTTPAPGDSDDAWS